MEKKLSKSETLRALRICAAGQKCTGCPAKHFTSGCIDSVMSGALEILQNQSRTIKELKKNLEEGGK